MVAQPLARYDSDINTHHMTLTDGTRTLGLILCDPQGNPNKFAIDEQTAPATALQVSNSGGGYDNYVQPYSPIPQVDWAGGLGMEYADQDMTRYLDGYCCDTSLGKIMPAGAAAGSNNGPTASVSLAESTNWDALTGYYWSLTPGALALKRIDVYVKVTAACRVTWTFRVTNDVSGGPGGTVDTIGVASGTWEFTAAEIGGAWKKINVIAALSAATKYWFCLENVTPTDSAAESLSYSYSSGNSVTTSAGVVIHANNAYSHKLYADNQDGFRFFIYRSQIYAVTVSSDGSAVRLYQGGFRGAAAANAGRLMKYLVSGVDMLTATGGKAIIIAGPGTREQQNWRTITSGGGTSQEVAPPWRITHTTSTEYVVTPIAGVAPWREVTGHGLTGPITGVCVVDDRAYFCQGDAANVRRMVYTTAGGHAWTDEGAQADHMVMFTDSDGKKRIFMAVAETSAVYKCEVGAAISTRTQVNNSLAVGSGDTWITNLGVYDDPQRPFVLKEDGFGSIGDNIYAPIPISGAMKAVQSRKNGKAVCANDRFLYFSMGPKLMRYYAGDLTNIGPDRDYGLPAERRGDIVDVVPYPGGVLYAAVDAGESGYSSVLKYNGQGWCEIWRAPFGERITNLIIQNVPGIPYQFLHVGCGDYIYRIHIAANPLQTTGFAYASTASLETGWYRTASKDIVKFFNAVKPFLLANSYQSVTAYYRTDANTAWTFLGTWGETDSGNEVEFNATNTVANDVTGTRIQLKFELNQLQTYYPSGIEQMVLTTVTRIPTKKRWNITARIFDHNHTLRGEMDGMSVAEMMAIINEWGNSEEYAKRVLAQSADYEIFYNKRVFPDPGSLRPIKADAAGARKVGFLARLALIEA